MNTKSSALSLDSLSVKSRKLATVLYRWEELLQKHFHLNVEAQTIMYFLHVASQTEPVDITSVGKVMGLSKAACSRNFYRLSVGLRGGNEGLGLLQYQDDPMDIRRKILTLTDKGTQAARELTDFISSQVERVNQSTI